jgi:HJR/Mrr/RecB family endonuclease
VNTNLEEIKKRLLAELRELSPRAFEHFCREFLAHLGYRSVEVTRTSVVVAKAADKTGEEGEADAGKRRV